jgi:putative ABC transport system substrate-binding protein
MQSGQLKRRQFIALLGSATAAWPLAARAQQPATPVVGFFRSTPAALFSRLLDQFREGLKEAGFVEGQNVSIDQRWADNQLDRLPEIAADLVRREVKVIVSNGPAVESAKAATSTIPIVFVIGEDPVARGLVASLNRPSGNLTGVTFFASQLGAKRMELLHELVPKASTVGLLVDGNFTAVHELAEAETAARSIGLQVLVVKLEHERNLDAAFAKIVQAGAGALFVSGSPLFTSQRHALIALAARHAIPAIYDLRDFVDAGGLISSAASIGGADRQAGVYAGRILAGAKPSELPVQQPTKFELAINLKTAKALGLTVPLIMQMTADYVIEAVRFAASPHSRLWGTYRPSIALREGLVVKLRESLCVATSAFPVGAEWTTS